MPVRFLSFSNDSALCADAVRSYTKNRLVRTLSPSINLFVGDYAASNRIEDLADQSEGIRRVAICRMDVDNLGQAFLAGFEQPDQTDPVQRMKYVNLFRATAEQTAALEDEAKKLPGKNGAALFDAVPDHTYSWDVLRDKVLGEKIPCLEQFFAQFQKKDDDHPGNSTLYNLTDLLRNTREDQVNFARCVYLLARCSCVNGETLPDFSEDVEVILRMFGGSEPVRFARLQFADAFLLNYDQLKGVGVTEVKSENVINRLTSKATPRQIERVVAGCRFGVNIVYNLSDPKEMEEDLSLLSKAMKLLQLDYLGGIGGRTSAGYGRFHLDGEPICLNTAEDASLRWMLQALERCTTLELHGAPLQMEPLGSHSVENGLQLLLAAREELASRTRLWFRTPCAFKQAGRYAIYPQEFLLLQSLVLHWNTAFPDCQLNDPDALDAILRGLHILDYNLHTVSYPIKNTRIPGFVGSAVVEARLAAAGALECPALLCALRRHRDQNHPWHGRRIGGAAGPAAEVSVSASAHTFFMFFPQGDESAVMTISRLPIFDRPGTVLPARGQQKRRPCRNADLHRAALLFSEHQTTIFPYEKRPFLPPLRETEKGIFVCPLAGVLDKISFRCTLRLES